MAERLTVRTPTLEIAYEARPAGGAPVILLHGFPYDSARYDEVAPPLAADGCRVSCRTCAATGRRASSSADTPRSGEQAALGHDLLRVHGRARRSRARRSSATTGAAAPPASSPRCGPSACARPGDRAPATTSRTSPPRRSRLRRAGAPLLVPVVLPHRARAGRASTQNRRDALPAAVAAVVAELELRRRDLRAQRPRLRQSRFRRRS